MYVVKRGRVLLEIPDKMPIEVAHPESFGEGCLREDVSTRFASAYCTENATLYLFSKADILKHLGSDLVDLEIHNKLLWALRENEHFNFPPLLIEAILQGKELHYYRDGEVIAHKGDKITSLLVSLEGGINRHPELALLNT